MEKGFIKGFTLIELLAVIVILAIILAVAIPSITMVVNNAKTNAFEDDAKMVIKAINYKMMEDNTFDPTTVTQDNILELLGLSNNNYESLSVSVDENGNIIVNINGKNKWTGLVASGSYKNMVVSNYKPPLPDYNETKGVNRPQLVTGMTPVKWNGSTWVETTASDTDWYDYTTKQWANAKTADGSMWVWIPRYVYKISSGWHTSTTGTINIQFSIGTDDTRDGTVTLDTGTTASASNNKWTNEPAFSFGTTELTGFWIAKFEASSNTPNATDGGGNTTSLYVKSIPNVSSWRGIYASNAFTVSRNMETNSVYGWGTSGNDIDTHLIKNTEWGAVTYLAQSTYGKNAEVWINNDSTHTTGCAGNSSSEASNAGCLNAYNTANGIKASTTGNIYGVYDMSGGDLEIVSAYIATGYSDIGTYGSNIVSADAKYKNVYNNYDVTDSTQAWSLASKGDAIYEISPGIWKPTPQEEEGSDSGWYGDATYPPLNDSYSWLLRDGSFDGLTYAGIFAYNSSYGAGSFRSIIAVDTDL